MTLPTLSSILLGNQYIGIEHYTIADVEYVALLLIEKRKDELAVLDKEVVTGSDSWPSKWNKKLPFFLIVNSSQIIHKEIESIDLNSEKLIHKAFPNLAWVDFYYEVWRLETKSVVAISRKSYVDAIIASYKEKGILIAGTSLGVCSLLNVVPFISLGSLHTTTQIVALGENSAIVTANADQIKVAFEINGLEIENTFLLAFSGVLRLLFPSNEQATDLDNLNNNSLDSFNQKKFFATGIKLMITGFLVVLLLNFMVFNYYFKKAEEATINLSLHQSSLENTNAIKSRIALKQEKVKNFTELSSSQTAPVINEITSLVPASILLDELIYCPLEKKIKEDEPIATTTKTIKISGATLDNTAFTTWIENIQLLKNIREVTILNFGKDETNRTVFTIKITLK